jgi:poly-gamma-glutamate synthesis protein (capsule biosynthesis protein)
VPATPAAGKPLDFSLGWQFGGYGHLADGVVTLRDGRPAFVVATLDRQVYALTGTGQVLWRAGAAGPAYALAVLDGGQVAVGDDAGHVTVFDDHGRRLWRHELGSRVTALYGNWQGGLLAGGWDERLTLLKAGTGREPLRWQVDLGGPVSGIAALSGPPGQSLALASTLDGDIRAFDLDGAEAWHFDAGVAITGLGTLEGEKAHMVLVGLQDGRLLALEPGMDGPRVLWQQDFGLGGPVWHVANLVGDAELEIVVGIGGQAPALALLSAGGDLVWRIATPAAVNALSTVDLDGDGLVASASLVEILAGLATGEIQAYDGQGRLRGSIHAGLPVWGLQSAGDRTALVLADVVAWQVSGRDGPSGEPWLPSPPLVPLPLQSSRWPPVGDATLQTSLGSASDLGSVGGLGSVSDLGSASDLGSVSDQGEALLAFLGDVAPGRSMEAQLARFGAAFPWQGIGPILHEADLAVANLEGVLTTWGQPLDKDYLIRAHPRWGQTLVDGGLDLVTLANNHALDFGQVGLDETLATLEALEIVAVGAGSSADTQRAHRPALFDLNGVRVGVLGYAAARWNSSEDVPATESLAWGQPDVVQANVRSVRDQADVVVVLLHAGTEYDPEPSPDQIAVARAAVDAGANLVVGHHAHVTQTVERYGEGLIVYGLGDALFDIPYAAAMQGDLLLVLVTEEGLARAELWPFWIEDAIRPRLLDDGEGGPSFELVYP